MRPPRGELVRLIGEVHAAGLVLPAATTPVPPARARAPLLC
ncbi:hypothetical protein ABZW30_01905 [Kitasatospora sp. NPDC004669]